MLGLMLALPAGASAGSVTVEVSTAAGVRLGRLVGEAQGGTTYYLLADVARLASASTRRGSRGDRMSLVSRHGVVQVARDARRITVDGQPVSLAAPVRVRQGTWRVPSDLLARALPTLVGTRVRVTDVREARGIPPGGANADRAARGRRAAARRRRAGRRARRRRRSRPRRPRRPRPRRAPGRAAAGRAGSARGRPAAPGGPVRGPRRASRPLLPHVHAGGPRGGCADRAPAGRDRGRRADDRVSRREPPQLDGHPDGPGRAGGDRRARRGPRGRRPPRGLRAPAGRPEGVSPGGSPARRHRLPSRRRSRPPRRRRGTPAPNPSRRS